MKVGKRWARMAEIYKRFAVDFPHADFGHEAALAMFRHETHGEPLPQVRGIGNGFALGKKLMDISIAGWREEIIQMGLRVEELIDDGYPEWFLERVGVLSLRPTVTACAWWLNK